MTIGERLAKISPAKYKDEYGVYDFRYIVEGGNGLLVVKTFKGRIDYPFITAEDGSDYVSSPLKGRNVGYCRAIAKVVVEYSASDILKYETDRVFESVLQGIAVLNCRMLEPIHIYQKEDADFIRVYGEAKVDDRGLKVQHLNY